MNILWDFRLFSYGYGNRGAGNYCRALANAILKNRFPYKLFVWGDKSKVTGISFNHPVTWIPYSSGNWKKDLLTIPLISWLYRIDIFHYWIALGPLYNIGIAAFNRGRTIAVVYDLGVELWNVPYCHAMKNSLYWKTQKTLVNNINHLIFISESTKIDFINTFSQSQIDTDVLYMPLCDQFKSHQKRESYFITLGGSPHKNLARTLKAFSSIHASYPDFKLIVLGEVNKDEESINYVPENVFFEPDMAGYKEHLKRSSGLLFCSIYEGLGIPPLDAMANGCPVLVSDIQSHNEICGSFAKKANPFSVDSIADGILDIIKNNQYWSQCARNGFIRYMKLCSYSARKCISFYDKFSTK